MTYSSGCGGGSCGYASSGLELAIAPYSASPRMSYSVAASRSSPSPSYSQEPLGPAAGGYVVDLDNKFREFISPYSGARSMYTPENADYVIKAYKDEAASVRERQEYQSMITHGLLRDDRPVTQFVNDAKEIEHLVFETFDTLTGRPFPHDIVIHVMDLEEMKRAHKAHGGKIWNDGILGFAINHPNRPGLIFLRKNHLDALMLTAGHEIGHVLTESLDNPIDEEAKAFAFEMAWAKTIIENDIGCLAKSFSVDFQPADNGIHNRAFNFVRKMTRKGRRAIDLFWDVAKRLVKVPSQHRI